MTQKLEDKARRQIFLAEIAESGEIASACKRIQISTRTARRFMQRQDRVGQKFREDYEQALGEYVARIKKSFLQKGSDKAYATALAAADDRFNPNKHKVEIEQPEPVSFGLDTLNQAQRRILEQALVAIRDAAD